MVLTSSGHIACVFRVNSLTRRNEEM